MSRVRAPDDDRPEKTIKEGSVDMNNWKEHVIMMYCSDCGGYRNQKFLQ